VLVGGLSKIYQVCKKNLLADERFNLKLLLVLILSLGLRLWGINFGLPHLYHADEPIVVNHALAYGTGDFNPHFFKIPPLVSYLVFGCFGLYYLALTLLGVVASVEEYAIFFLSDPGSFYLLARVLFGAICGTLSVALFAVLLRRYFSRRHALWGALLFGISFLHVRDSHYIYADIPLILALVACFFPILQIETAARRRDYFLFGILMGLAVAIKYNGVFIVIPFLIAHVMARGVSFKSIWNEDLMASAACSIVTFAVLNPYSWLDAPFFLQELTTQSGSQSGMGLLHHLRYSLAEGLGWGILVASAIGILLLLWNRERKRMLMASFLIMYYLVLVKFSQPYDRYALPLIPWLVFMAVDAVIRLTKAKRRLRFAAIPLWVFLGLFPFSKSIHADWIMTQVDARTEARAWILENIPEGSLLALDTPFFMPRLSPTIEQLREKHALAEAAGTGSVKEKIYYLMRLSEGDRSHRERRYNLFFLNDNEDSGAFLFSKPAISYDLKALRERGIEYVLFAKVAEAHQQAFYQALRKTATLVSRFSPYHDEALEWAIDEQPLTGQPFLSEDLRARRANGPIIEIYEV